MNKEKKPAQVFHFDLQGKREFKYDFLSENSLSTISWNELKPEAPNFFLVKKNFDQSGLYEKGFKVDELFTQHSSGVETRKDSFVIDFEEIILKSRISDMIKLNIAEIERKYGLNNESRDWKIEWAVNDLKGNNPKIQNIIYKPFDIRKIMYTGKTKGINGYPMYANFKHFISRENFGLCLMKKIVNTTTLESVFITKTLMDKNLYGFQTYAFPLYLYSEKKKTESESLNFNVAAELEVEYKTTERTPNLNPEIVKQIAEKLNLEFVNEKINNSSLTINNYFAPIDILDYIYAVLHSPTYREKYKEFLKIDFPRVPYPKDLPSFQNLVSLGGQLRQLHLLESSTVEQYITQYPEDGNNVVVKPRFSPSPSGRAGVGLVYINDKQYFDNVPEVAWNFYIGGYQPAQKWLKDRKDRKLEFDDILHYQKIIVALTETDRLMKEIDKIEIE